MELRELTPKEFIILQNKFPSYIILAGRTFSNLTVILVMENQGCFQVFYTENGFKSFDVHKYRTLKDAFEDYDNAYVLEQDF